MPAKALFFEPMLCDKAEQPPEGPEWSYELKLDGYRAIGFKTDGQAPRLWSRNGKDLVRRFSEVAKDEARVMLAEIYDWFTEGFDTADLKEAKSLLKELNSKSS